MKKSIYISGIASANLMLFGSLFKVMHWPGANVLLMLSIFLFCFYFLPASLLHLYKEQEQKKFKWLYTITFIVFFIGMMGVLFKVLHWPGAAMFLLVGIPLPFVLFLPVYLYQTRNEKKDEVLNFLGIMFGLTFLAVFSVLLSLNVSKNVMFRISENIIYNDQSASFNLSKAKDLPETGSIKQQSDELCAYIENLKCELLTASGNEGCKAYDPSQLANMENSDIPMRVLHVNEKDDKVEELKAKIDAYKATLLASGRLDKNLSELANVLFDTSFNEPQGKDHLERDMVSWGNHAFSSYQLIVVLDVLTQIQSNVRLVEAEALAGM